MSDSDVKNSELILKEYDLEELKNFFKEEINSVRRLDEISSLEVLLDVLRDRNALTSDIFKKLGPDFQRLVNSNSEEPDSQKVYLPPKVFKFIAENYKQDWKQFAEYLKLSPNLIDKCYDVSSVLSCFENNCVGISNQEIIYRLKRALERSDENEMKEEISKMMADPTS